MIEGLFNLTNYQSAKKLMDVTEMRQRAIASNIANVETPGYKRVDVPKSFQEKLRQAISTKDKSAISSLQPRIETDAFAIARTKDGNTGQIENEMLRLNENAMEHQMEVRLVNGTLSYLKMAITGKA